MIKLCLPDSLCVPRGRLVNASLIPDEQQQTIAVTHPFSPFYGQLFTLVKKTNVGGKNRLICLDESGNIRTLLTSWTNYPTNNPNKALMEKAGLENADFRYEDLDRLAKMLSNIRKV